MIPVGATPGSKPEWRSGEALWCAFHHGSIAGEFMGRMGMIDYFRLPLRTWHWYRNAYRGIAPPEWPPAGTAAKLQLDADRATFSNDGTEDCHLIVSVLDANGKAITNSPQVSLTIVSGPGKFPTGPTITFTPNTDIDIRDGQAAIEFRSYHGGTTVIRASSPGLQAATITLTTTGEPVWHEDMANLREVRSYPGPLTEPPPEQALAANLALRHPAGSSSQQPANPAGNANDGDPNTRWCAESNALPAWWRVDMEGLYFVTQVRISFEQTANYRFRIELSQDGETWTLASDQSARQATEQACTVPIAADTRARFLRIVYTGVSDGFWPSHREVGISGTRRKP